MWTKVAHIQVWCLLHLGWIFESREHARHHSRVLALNGCLQYRVAILLQLLREEHVGFAIRSSPHVNDAYVGYLICIPSRLEQPNRTGKTSGSFHFNSIFSLGGPNPHAVPSNLRKPNLHCIKRRTSTTARYLTNGASTGHASPYIIAVMPANTWYQ